MDNWETASEGGSGIDDDQQSTGNVWGNDDSTYAPDSPNVEKPAKQIGKCYSKICGVSGSPDGTDDSEVTLTDISADSADLGDLHRSESSSPDVTSTPSPKSDFNDSPEELETFDEDTQARWDSRCDKLKRSTSGDRSDHEEDIEAIIKRELLEGGMANVTLYTPPATRQSDYERDEFEQSIETMEPKRLFQAGYREDGLDATTDGTTTTDDDADANKLNENVTLEPVPDDRMHTGVCMPATWDSSGDHGATELNNAPTNMTLTHDFDVPKRKGSSHSLVGTNAVESVPNQHHRRTTDIGCDPPVGCGEDSFELFEAEPTLCAEYVPRRSETCLPQSSGWSILAAPPSADVRLRLETFARALVQTLLSGWTETVLFDCFPGRFGRSKERLRLRLKGCGG